MAVARENAERVLVQIEKRGARDWRVEEIADGQYILVGDCTQTSNRDGISPLSIVSEVYGDMWMGRIFGVEDEYTHRLLVWCIDCWHIYEKDRVQYKEYRSTRGAEKRLVSR